MNANITRRTRRALSLAALSVPLSLLILSACGGGATTTPIPVNLTTGQAAAVVVGQVNFTNSVAGSGAAGLNMPGTGTFFDSGNLYVSDRANNRVLVFGGIPTLNGASASYALGQPNLTTYASGVSATTLNQPQNAVVSGGKLFVTDYFNHRIAIFNTVPAVSPGTMDVVAGQTSKTTNVSACTAAGLFYPQTVSVAKGKMVVADASNNRVLIWNSIPVFDGTAADLVLGQTTMTSCNINAGGFATASTMSYAGGTWTDGIRLVVLDRDNNRVLIWNSFPTVNGQPADLVLGQQNFTSGASSAVSATTLNNPYGGVFVSAANQLLVTDTKNNRVLVWKSFPTVNGQPADVVLGQPNFTTNTLGLSATTLNLPTGVYVSGTHVFVTDTNNNRVLIY